MQFKKFSVRTMSDKVISVFESRSKAKDPLLKMTTSIDKPEVKNDEIVIPEPSAEERHLSKLVFGDEEGFENNLRKVDQLYDEEREQEEKNPELYYSDSEGSDEFLNAMQHQDQSDPLAIKHRSNDSVNDSSSDEDEDNDVSKLNDDQLFMVDENANSDVDAMDVDSDESDSSHTSSTEDTSDLEEKDAWIDSDDEKLTISLEHTDRLRKLRISETESDINGKKYISRLRDQFERIFPRPDWADRYPSDEEEQSVEAEDSEISKGDVVGSSARSTKINKSSNPLLEFLNKNQTYKVSDKNMKLLSPRHIDISRLTDANVNNISHSAVQALSFHPTHPLILTGGYDRTLRIYHIDGKHNHMVSSLHFKNAPVQSAYFGLNDDTEIFSGGRRRYMYKWSVNQGIVEKISRLYGHEQTQRSFENFKLSPDGKYIGLVGSSGWVNLLSATTGRWVRGFKIEGTLVDFEFTQIKNGKGNSKYLIAINSAGEIWEFEIQTGKILSRWTDNTGVGVTKIKVGGNNGNNRWLAVGSKSGMVNIYDRMKNNKLIGTIENLVTSISSLEFNVDGQLLCIASRAKRDALRLVHIPTCKTYSNWPTSGTPLGKVTSICFSPNSEMLATGNEAGRVRLWHLNHY